MLLRKVDLLNSEFSEPSSYLYRVTPAGVLENMFKNNVHIQVYSPRQGQTTLGTKQFP